MYCTVLCRVGILCTDSYEEVMKIASDPVAMRKEGFVVQKYIGAARRIFLANPNRTAYSYSTRVQPVLIHCAMYAYSTMGIVVVRLLRVTHFCY